MPLSRLKICSLLALALLVGGCGSSHSGSATTTISSAPTTGPTQAGGSVSETTGTGATGSTQTSHPNPTKPEKTKPLEFKEGASEPAKMKVREKETGVPVKRQYPTALQEGFTTTCTAAGGSHSACECIVKKLELTPLEKGHSLAELLATYVGLRKTSYEAIVNKTPGLGPAGGPVQVPSDAYKYMIACKAA
jgi:hypothetical protein